MTKIVILVFLLLSTSVGLFGQYGWTLNMFEPEIIDARAEALGRASILSSSSASFIFNNPAMLSNLLQKNVQFSGRSVFGKNERQHEYNGETDKTEHEYPLHMKFNGFAFGIPYNMSENDNYMEVFFTVFEILFNNSMSSIVAMPSVIFSKILNICLPPTRQGVHFPQDSSIVKSIKNLATFTIQSSSSSTIIPPDPIIEPNAIRES